MTRFVLEWESAMEMTRVYGLWLSRGRANIDGRAPAAVGSECELEVRHPDSGESLVLAATVKRVIEEPPSTELTFRASDELETFVTGEAPTRRAGVSPLEAVRNLSAAEQRKFARSPDPQKRAALERLYGKAVWEALLGNPAITVPEVARIARKGAITRPLLERIVDNKQWIKTAPVRRALLSNPRLTAAAARKVLTLAPRHEVQVVSRQMSYPQTVRNIAKQLAGS